MDDVIQMCESFGEVFEEDDCEIEILKKCTKCGVEKVFGEFSKDKNKKDGYMGMCRECRRNYRQSEEQKKKQRKYSQSEKCKEGQKNRRQTEDYKTLRKETDSKYRKTEKYVKYHKDYQQTEKYKEYHKDYQQTEKYKEYQKKYHYSEKCKQKNKEYRKTEKYKNNTKKYNKEKRAIDPIYKLRQSISCKIRKMLKSQNGSKAGQSILKYLPYTFEQLKCHLESQFDENMTWNNYGIYWHIDHIYPQSLLPFDSMEHSNFLKCWSLDNLRPLEALENLKKGNKIIELKDNNGK